MIEFIPTDEWQEVPEDAACPPGLEYRLGMEEGGKKFARKQQPAAAENPNLAQALAHAARGWFVFPCREKPGQPYYSKKDKAQKTPQPKQPYWHKDDLPNGKDNATTDPEIIRRWWARWPDAWIGIYCEKSGIFALDIDRKAGVDGMRSWEELVETHGKAQPVEAGPAQKTPNDGYHILFKLPAGLTIPNNAKKLAPGLDLRSNGYICSGGPYEWLPDHGPDQRLTDAPDWLLDLIRDMATRPNMANAEPANSPPLGNTDDAGAYWLRKALEKAVPGNRNNTGFWLACQLRDAGITESAAEDVAKQYSHKVSGTGYTEGEALASVKEAYKAPRREVARGLGLRVASSNSNGYHSAGDITGQPPAWWSDDSAEDGQPEEKIHLTDMGNARRFAQQHAGRVCYTKAWDWLVWTGKKWERDETGAVVRLAKETVKQLYRDAERAIGKVQTAIRAAQAAAEQGDEKAIEDATKAAKEAEKLANALLAWAIKSQSAQRLAAITGPQGAQGEPEIAARTEDFDKDHWLLNVQNGVLDLRTGELKPHDPRLKITKLAGAVYDPAATCPGWLRFLNRIFDNDQTVISFLQRAVGYSLTGDTGEQCLFFLHGTGANGKSTFTRIIESLLSDYAAKVRAETLLIKKFDSIPEDVARLAGIRFALTAELTEGQLNEGLVKDLTGGDKMAGRLLYKATFEFWPDLKLWMYGNKQPTITGVDNGIWRRINLVPFDVTIPDQEQDSKLPEKLLAELPGILTWAVRGCMEWQRIGLEPPAKVNKATQAYREQQDIFGQFFSACCVINEPTATMKHHVAAGALLDAFNKWGGNDMKPQTFSKKMRERGFITSGRDTAGRALYEGIGLIDPTTGLTTEAN